LADIALNVQALRFMNGIPGIVAAHARADHNECRATGEIIFPFQPIVNKAETQFIYIQGYTHP